MARYFFDIRDGSEKHVRDYEGVELPGIEDARRIAVEIAKDVAAESRTAWENGIIEIWSDTALLEVVHIAFALAQGSPTRH